jgi:hypothetical protein
MEKRVGIRLEFGVCSTPEGQVWVNLEKNEYNKEIRRKRSVR